MSPINRKLTRREILSALGVAGVGLATGCAGSAASPSSTGGAITSGGAATTAATSSTGSCTVTPEETAGPYPDRTGMINNPAFFRQDITEGKAGLPLTLALTVVNVNKSCSPVSNASIEVWQCDATGNYSEYSQPGYDGTGQTFLRGVQTTDSQGQATFRAIYPGWYMGRATHIHLEVFVNGAAVKTTQMAFPEDISSAVYRTGVYAAHGQNSTANARDNVFSDGTQYELASLSGDATIGYTAALTIAVSL